MEESGGYIKLYRKFTKWEWYDDINTKTLFLHLLLTVNWQEGKWHGITIPRGSKITSISKLACETGLSPRNVRTALEHLKSTNEVTCETTKAFTLISIVKYGFYQVCETETDTPDDKQSDKEATKNRQTGDKQVTTIEEEKEIKKNNKKNIYGVYKHVKLSEDEYQKLHEEYPNADKLIAYLDEAKEMKGYKYKSDYLAIKKWVVDAVNKKPAQAKVNRDMKLPKWYLEQQNSMEEKKEEEHQKFDEERLMEKLKKFGG